MASGCVGLQKLSLFLKETKMKRMKFIAALIAGIGVMATLPAHAEKVQVHTFPTG
jgi:hypothetical protein